MRWGQGSIAFARPIQWLLALYDGQVMEFSVDATSSGSSTRGHRFMAPERVRITGAEQYINTLRDNWVIVENKERRQRVIDEVKRVVQDQRRFAGAEPVLDDDLVDTVTNLVEIPWGVCGSFDEKFLELPQEVLITSMREHQKYFPVRASDGNLLPLFVAVNNTRVDDLELAVSGHQRVLRARLEDGLFFFRADRKKRLADRRHQACKV
jgi:glycyl-tRNA synthetase beta chain